jgi:phytoene dehydrogenase-like protein
MKSDHSIIIIGGGFAGLAAGIYAQMNGYNTRIFEMHDKPGGLCTSWKRKGYTIDGCIHWLVGSNPSSRIHDFWEEVGVARGLQVINMDEYMRFEGTDGRQLIFYTDLNRLEKHLLEFSPEDAEPVRDFISGVKMCLPFDNPSLKEPLSKKLKSGLRMGTSFLLNGKKWKRWMNTTAEEFAGRFKDPLLAQAFRNVWLPEFSMFFMLFTFAYLHHKNAGYPIGGSLPMSEAMAARYISLGGTIGYNCRVEKILTENNGVTGVKLADGTVHLASRVISAADGHTTLFGMLDGKYGDEQTFKPYEKWPRFPSLLFAGIGVNDSFDHIPLSISGTCHMLKEPVMIGGSVRENLWVHIFNHDKSMAPAGKTTLTVMMHADYDYWKNLSEERSTYQAAKESVARAVTRLLEEHYPGISEKVEMTDVATPMTFERYTGNWKGSFEGWLITPENASVIMKPMPKTLPGLKNFYMCGQWVEPGGGLPTGVMSGRKLLQMICREDGRKFKTVTDDR